MTVPGRVVEADEAAPPGTAATEPGPAPGPAPEHARSRRDAIRFWRSPPGQPPWARPALLVITALATFGYAWGIGNGNLEPFYGAAARSMSQNWHNFIFGAFDPWGTVTVDKLPGALWVQALSLRLFGFHLWAIVLPQVVEGALTVLVIYRAVRRVAGAGAGLVAALVLAVSPVTILLNRGNISDSVLILLLVLAADATTKAFMTGRIGSLLWAGVWVGLAFQAKMLQAWLVLPALFGVYLVAAPAAAFLRRLAHVALATLVVVVVSLSFMTAVTAVPAHDRPYVDGSCDNSLYSQVFLYNGIDRFAATRVHQQGCSPPSHFLLEASEAGAALDVGTATIPAGWGRLFHGPFGRDDAWFVIPSVVAALGLLAWCRRRRRPRTDPLRAATLLWAGWLVLTWVFFSGGRYLNSYYLAALIPAMAALCGLGASVAWHHRQRVATRVLVLVTVLAGTAYADALVPAGSGIRAAVIASSAACALAAAGILGASLRQGHASVWALAWGPALAGVALLSSAAWASGSVIVAGLGPFDTPYQPSRITEITQVIPALNRRYEWPLLEQFADNVPRGEAADVIESSYLDSANIFATGREFLSVGGFSGEVPAPPLSQFVRDVATGKIHQATAAIAPRSRNPDIDWVIAHCQKQTTGNTMFTELGTTMQRYTCTRSDGQMATGASAPVPEPVPPTSRRVPTPAGTPVGQSR
jgi:4-amino-4-deoxy-L-arabinose transferase-like glycosyltransferase